MPSPPVASLLLLISVSVFGEQCYDLSQGCQADSLLAAQPAVPDPHSCQLACQTSTGCTHFTWFSEASPTASLLCLLYSSCDLTPCSACISGPASCTCSSPGACLPEDDGGNQLGAVTGVSAEAECQLVCTDTDSCQAYTWYGPDSALLATTCLLYSSCKHTSTDCTDCVSGRLDCLPSCSILPPVDHGEWQCSGAVSGTNDCQLECDPGHVATGRTFSSCTAGTWTSDVSSLVCEPGVLLLSGGGFPTEKKVEVFSPELGCNKSLPNLPEKLTGHSLSLVDGEVLSCGCSSNTNGPCQSSCSSMQEDHSWAPYSSLLTPRWGHSAVTLHSSLNIVGGRFAGGKQLEKITPSAKLISRSQNGPVLLQANWDSCSVKTGADTLVTTGGVADPTAAIQFTSSTNSFLRLQSLGQSRTAHACAYVKTMTTRGVVVAGGWSGLPLNSAEIYSYALTSWSPLPDMAAARDSFPHMTMLGTRLFIIGGGDSTLVEELIVDSQPMAWTNVTENLTSKRKDFGATMVPASKYCF